MAEVGKVASAPMNRFDSNLSDQQRTKTAAFEMLKTYGQDGHLLSQPQPSYQQCAHVACFWRWGRRGKGGGRGGDSQHWHRKTQRSLGMEPGSRVCGSRLRSDQDKKCGKEQNMVHDFALEVRIGTMVKESVRLQETKNAHKIAHKARSSTLSMIFGLFDLLPA